MKLISKIAFLLLFIAFSLTAWAQQLNIAGTVLDENSEPVIGASVIVKGTTIGAMTDVSGNYSIQAPADATLVISFSGMTDKEEAVAGRARIDVSMATAANELDEVVVVGYGVQKKAHLTGAVATVAPTEIADLVTTDMASALEGIVAGVSVTSESNRPGEQSRIVIRNGNEVPGAPNTSVDLLKPLYVIDDYIADENAFNNLDPSTVESISILKDASAAVYGARSAQGVVLVKTKRGTVGKPKISYNGQFGWADEYYRNKMMSSYDFGVAWNAVRAADPTQTGFDPIRHLFQADELEAMKGLNYDLLEQYWSSAITQKHSINVSGGSENANYFGSVGYTTQDGNMGKIDYDRWNYRVGVDAKINKWTKASLQLSGDYGTITKANSRVGGTNAEKDYAILLTRPRYFPEYVTDPATGETYPIAPYGMTNSSIETTQNYHYSMIQNLGDFTQNMPQNMVINSGLEYDFGWNKWLQGLRLKATYSKSISNTKNNEFGSKFEIYKFTDGVGGRGGSGGHLYTDTEGYPLNFNNISTVPVDNGNNLRREMSRSDNYQLNFIASYMRDFGKHSVSGLFTIEKSESESENVWGNVTDPYTFTTYQSDGAAGTNQTTRFSRSESGMLSYVGRLNYAYDDKYLAEFLVRTDASTKFAPENYWGTFPSMSLGWIISRESWFSENVSFVDFLKLRGSFGILGRDNISPWAWLVTYATEAVKAPIFGSNPGQNAGSHFQYPAQAPNRNAHWDKTYKSNFGIDANFLNNRLSVALDAYYNWQRDVFMTVSNAPEYPTTVGATAAASNYGAINDYGVELSLGWRDKIGSDFKYFVKLTTGWSDNKILTFPFKEGASLGLEDEVRNERSDRGLWGMDCIGMFRTYQEIAEYFAENNIRTYFGKDVNNVHPGMLIYRDVRGTQKEDGTYYAVGDPDDPNGNVIDKGDFIKISDRKKNIYGFTLTFGGDWKGISLSAQLGASWGSYTMLPNQARKIQSIISTADGYDVMQYTNLPSFYAGDMFIYEDVLDAQGRVVAAQNRDAHYPNMRFADNGEASTFWKVNAANIFLRNLTVAYTLPKSWANKIKMESLRVNLTAQNLFELYNPYPDKFMSPNSNYSRYPTLRRITMGLNISF